MSNADAGAACTRNPLRINKTGPPTRGITQGMTRYAVPAQCIFCGNSGRVVSTARTTGGRVVMCWNCEDCGREWPIKHQERLEERRNGAADRRRYSRADRRSRST